MDCLRLLSGGRVPEVIASVRSVNCADARGQIGGFIRRDRPRRDGFDDLPDVLLP